MQPHSAEDLHAQIVTAILSVRSQVRWKPGNAAGHLLKRKLRGHLSPDATVDDYERIILTTLEDERARVYVYWHNEVAYVSVVAVVQNRHWLVMFSLDGRIESAYVVENPDRYLSKSVFELIGSLNEVIP
jgi:hypothetical protein